MKALYTNQIVVPLDAHLDLYHALQKNADEFGDEVSLRRTDLALFDFDAANMVINCRLVEVKCYGAAGGLSGLINSRRPLSDQIQQSRTGVAAPL